MQTKFTIAMVVMLMAAAFVGVVAMDDEADAEGTTYAVSLGDTADFSAVVTTVSAFTNESLGNKLTVDNSGKISGTVSQAPAGYVTALWGASNSAKHIIVYTISVPVGQYVVWKASDNSGLKSEQAGADGKVIIASAIKESDAGFTFVVSTSDLAKAAGGDGVFEAMPKQAIIYDLTLLGEQIKVEYIVGETSYSQNSIAGQAYKLVSLDAFNLTAPAGKKFIGWADTYNTYSIGTELKLDAPARFTAVFEDITPVVTFAVNGVVVPELTKTINYGEKIVAPEVPEGCTGWDFDFAQAIFADVQIDAILEEVPEVQVTFFDGITYYGPVKVSEIKDKIPTVTKNGHDFVGWFIDGVKVDPLAYEFTEDTTLVAGWDPIKCKVVFMVGGVIYKEQTVEYGKTATEAVLPEGYSAWDFKFDTPITKDLTVITAIEKAPEKPTGLADPTVKMALVIVGLFVCVLLAVIILKREDIRAGMVRKLSKAEDVKEDKKE